MLSRRETAFFSDSMCNSTIIGNKKVKCNSLERMYLESLSQKSSTFTGRSLRLINDNSSYLSSIEGFAQPPTPPLPSAAF